MKYRYILDRGNSLAKFIDGVLYIRSKYTDSEDIIFTFKERMFNSIMTFGESGTTTDLSPSSSELFNIEQIVVPNGGDNIGGYNFKNVGWVSGNHSLVENQVNLKTANCVDYKFFCEEEQMNQEGVVYFGKYINITVENHAFDPRNGNTDGSLGLLLKEYVWYSVQGASINVSVAHKRQKNEIIRGYLGMHLVGQTWQEKVLIPNGQDTSLQDKVNNVRSGNVDEYPNVFRFVTSKTDKSICLSGRVDNSGLFAKRNAQTFSYLPDGCVKLVSDKIYHNAVNQVNIDNYNVEDTEFWHGNYTIFKDNSNVVYDDVNIEFAYIEKDKMKDRLIIDIKDTVKTLILPKNYVGRECNIIEKTDSVTVNEMYVHAKGIEIQSTGYGNLILEFT